MHAADNRPVRNGRSRSWPVAVFFTVALVLVPLLSPFSPATQAQAATTATVSGTITGSDRPGVGVAGIGVFLDVGCYGESRDDLYYNGGCVELQTTTDSSGHYTVSLADGGATHLVFKNDQYLPKAVTVNLVAGQTITSQDFIVDFAPILRFHAYYNDASHSPAASRTFGLALGGENLPRQATTDANGAILFTNLPSGDFRLYDTQYPKAFPDQRVIVGGANTTIADLIVDGPITFSAVTVELSTTYVHLSLIGVAPTTASYKAQYRSTIPQEAQFQDVAPGSYILSAVPDYSGEVPTWWPASYSAEGATPVVVGTEGKTVTVSLPLLPPGTLTSALPVISGQAVLGGNLTVAPGTWGPTPVVLSYQWTRNGSAIPGATASSYTLTGDDLGKPISVNVTGTKASYATAARTAASVTPDPGFTAAPVPTISGSTVPGSTLTATVGVWTPAPGRFTYAWLRNGVAIAGETTRTHRLVTADIGSKITFRVTGAKAGIPAMVRTSAATGTVAYVFTAAAVPVISGRPTIGTQLSVSTGSVTPAATSFTYAWLKNGSAITGATTATYTPSTSDAGATLSVRVTAVRSGYASLVRTTASTVVIQNGFTATPTPAIIGAAKVGVTLVASTSSWRPLPVQLSFQWKVNGVVVPDTGGTIYNPTTADIGKTITLTVTGTKDGYLTESRTSVATRPVVGALSTTTPEITGTATAGSTLTGHAGAWGPAPVTLAFQWLRCGTPISGATAGSYRLVTADRGKSITLKVTGTKSGYATQALTSAAMKVAP